MLEPLTASLNPDKSHPKLAQSSLRTINTMLDTYVSPTAPLSPAVAISSAIYTPNGLRNLCAILSKESPDRLTQEQIVLAASAIAKSCGRVPHTAGGESEEGTAQQEGMHQKMLVSAGVLDALTTRLASFAPDEYRKKCGPGARIPPQAPPYARIAPILDAIATIIRGSKLRSIEFLFSPALTTLLPTNELVGGLDGAVASLHLPQPKPTEIQGAGPIVTPSAFPPLSAAAAPTASSQFPLRASAASHSMGFPALHQYSNYAHSHHHLTEEQRIDLLAAAVVGGDDDSETSGGETPLRRRLPMAAAEWTDDERLRPALSAHEGDEGTDTSVDIPELEVVNWLISLVRTGDPDTRLTAASVLTNLFLVGLVARRLVSYVALLVIPILVRLLDEEYKVSGGFGNAGVGGVDAQKWSRWQVGERAPAVLSRLVIENLDFQKAAIDAGAIKKLAATLKKVSESPSGGGNGLINGDTPYVPQEPPFKSNPEYSHRMKVKEGVLRCLANLGLFSDDYRRKIVDAGVLKTVVGACLKPLTPIASPPPPENNSAEGNPPSVLIAACGCIRALSRSISILRTSLMDAGVALPTFSLVRHDNDDVKIAATAAVCNLVLDFSPMRKSITEAGALEVLCNHVKGSNGPLRLNALWALKHLMLEADAAMKRSCLECLGVEYLMSIISKVNADPAADPVPDSDSDVDEEMTDHTLTPTTTSDLSERLPPKIRSAVHCLQKQERIAQGAESRKEAIALQEQGLEFIRNLICGVEVGAMIDLVLNSIGADRLLTLYQTLLSAPNQPSEIVNAVVYNIVHIAAGAPRHRQRIIERTELLQLLLVLWNHRNPHVRSGLAWVVINLTWKEEGNEAEGVQRRITVLKNLGWAEGLRLMQKDTELDVRERVKTAEFQLNGQTTGGSAAASGSVAASGGAAASGSVTANGASSR